MLFLPAAIYIALPLTIVTGIVMIIILTIEKRSLVLVAPALVLFEAFLLYNT